MDVTTTLSVVGITAAVKNIAGEKVAGWVTVAVAVAAGVALAIVDTSALPSAQGLLRGALEGLVAVGGVTIVDRVRG